MGDKPQTPERRRIIHRNLWVWSTTELIKKCKYVVHTYLLWSKGQNLQALVQVCTKADHTNAPQLRAKQETNWVNFNHPAKFTITRNGFKIGAARLKLTVDTCASILILPLSGVNRIMIDPMLVSLMTANENKIKCCSQANKESPAFGGLPVNIYNSRHYQRSTRIRLPESPRTGYRLQKQNNIQPSHMEKKILETTTSSVNKIINKIEAPQQIKKNNW